VRIDSLTRQVNQRYSEEGLPSIPVDWFSAPGVEDETYPPRTSFNLISAVHHVSGTMAFTFECSHGTISHEEPEPMVGYGEILDIQLQLYQEMLDYALTKRLYGK
jgi:hypothetical protein